MKSSSLVRALCRTVMTLAVVASASSTAVASYSQVVFFGDSLSDTGNLYQASGVPVSPPYYQGGFSNGPLWTTTLAGYLGGSAVNSFAGGTNYAWAGATVFDYGRPTPELPLQLGQYFAAHAADPNALYVILGGGNDINDAGKNPATAASNVQAAAVAIDGMVDSLYGAGARNILVGNLPDIGKTPLALSKGLAASAGATQLTLLFNGTLGTLLANDQQVHTGLNLDVLDLYGLFNQVLANPLAYGFDDVDTGCKSGELGLPGQLCATPNTYLFWDDFHPSARAHNYMADAALRAVPEPGALLLVALSLAAFLTVRPAAEGRRTSAATCS
ncbi:MAG: SGNH/GDSL hydrolase family protein [Candidatus Accumulibacter sp.]|uniref:SGNH/GDSL hydrolase family protein n=1 Tax=Candidatus Accumulibacter proximus TaxID=2954385 RepID=A0A935UEK1_9PROT|nr:SGNH/GDSL hydrolase family protein [Candidatus Accumulibacter proximus]